VAPHVPVDRIRDAVKTRASEHVQALRMDQVRANVQPNILEAFGVTDGDLAAVAQKIQSKVDAEVSDEVARRVQERLQNDIEENFKEQLKQEIAGRVG